jgi:hypothetical protein
MCVVVPVDTYLPISSSRLQWRIMSYKEIIIIYIEREPFVVHKLSSRSSGFTAGEILKKANADLVSLIFS